MTKMPDQQDLRSPDADVESDNWLTWIDNPSPADLEWIAQEDARDHRVGALLRELYYFDRSDPPRTWNQALQTEEDFWIGQAAMAPGYQVEHLEAVLARKRDPSMPAPDFKARQDPGRLLRHDVLTLYEVGMRKSMELLRSDTTLTYDHCHTAISEFLRNQIEGADDWQPVQGAMDVAVKALVNRAMERHRPATQ